MMYQALGDQRALAAIYRAMAIYPATLQTLPQAGWGLQHSVTTLAPVGARSYEPEALVTSTTADNTSLMMDFYEWTGEQQFLERLLEVFRVAGLGAPAAGRGIPADRRSRPSSNSARTSRCTRDRRGSNVVNGEYYVDYDPRNRFSIIRNGAPSTSTPCADRFRRLTLTTPAGRRAGVTAKPAAGLRPAALLHAAQHRHRGPPVRYRQAQCRQARQGPGSRTAADAEQRRVLARPAHVQLRTAAQATRRRVLAAGDFSQTEVGA